MLPKLVHGALLAVIGVLLSASAPVPAHAHDVAHGNVAACYSPMHSWSYPLNGGHLQSQHDLRESIRADFRQMSKYFKHVRTYYAQFFGVEVAPIAAEFGIKLYMGVFMTNEYWWHNEVQAAVNAVRNYPGTVEVLFVGNENLWGWKARGHDILHKVNQVRGALGGDAWWVKFGTVQRITEYLDHSFDYDTRLLSDNLDILGVNIYPFFTNSYDRNQPTALLDAMWNNMARKFPAHKMRLTETGFATAGGHNPVAPRVVPNMNDAMGYYKGLAQWNPAGAESTPKFWFMAFDRRWDDHSMGMELEKHFGFFTADRHVKQSGFPLAKGQADQKTPSRCQLEVGVDYVAHDIGSAWSADPNSCCAICRSRPGCRAFSWNNYQGGTCWLKSGKAAVQGKNGVISAVVA